MPKRRRTPRKAAPWPNAGSNTISIDDFAKIDLRIARMANAEHVEGADKLLRLTLDLPSSGPAGVAGINRPIRPKPWSDVSP